ncbi:protein lin-28 homolog [Caerostris extrusa]|uniref:Protein lin-28 homolog n=1 Tax=Caerostris extrusa TaxID=172846 RepID=A0AAV4T9I6_CAEEX|nr:protein lin-28 homolog [Caerostris extrusa]
MSGFRSLGDEEEVEFDCKVSDKGLEATVVTGPQSSDCKGSHRRPMSKKRFRKIRCYNCGEFANHIAAKCNLGPQPKRCHSCKSDDHLIADCPSLSGDQRLRNQDQRHLPLLHHPLLLSGGGGGGGHRAKLAPPPPPLLLLARHHHLLLVFTAAAAAFRQTRTLLKKW